MATFSVNIEGYFDVEAKNEDEAWEIVNRAISPVFYEVREKNNFVDGEIEIGEVEEN